MEVKPGCITGLVGRNGAGKSTTFKAVLDLVRPQSGSVRVFGTDSRHLSAEEKKMGVVLSDSGFSEYLTVRDINSILNAVYEKHDGGQFLAQCSRLDLPTDKKVKEFSTGIAGFAARVHGGGRRAVDSHQFPYRN